MMLPRMKISDEALSRFGETAKLEWIITNGLGGFSSSTIFGLNTRKYHGLLVAALDPPANRRICLAKLDEEVSIENETYPLGSNEFQNEIFPKGHLFMKEFTLSLFPQFTYAVKNVEVKKTVFMPYQKNAIIAFYKVSNRSDLDATIRVYPLMNWRHMHSVTDRWKVAWEFVQKRDDKEVNVHLDVPKSVLMMKSTGGRYNVASKWIERLYYREENLRGESCLDDCYQLGYFEVEVKANQSEDFAVTTVADKDEFVARKLLAEMPNTAYDVEALFEREIARRESLLTAFFGEYKNINADGWLKWLVLATDMFRVKEKADAKSTLIAGYHWFETWGRDTFVSLPGLLLVTKRFEDARDVFVSFKDKCKEGLIPNFIPDKSEQLAYNTVDASLWYVNAVLQYLKHTNDFRFVHTQLWETLKAIIEEYSKGTDFGIHVDSDGLVSHASQLTWMDAATEGQAVTPRAGKAVEVQALWYNALKIMELLANRFSERNVAESYARLAGEAKKSFVEKFWNAEKNCLVDVVSEHSRDVAVRPNQIFAVALDFTMLDRVNAERIVDLVQHELLTPYGLRTLAKDDPQYVGVYAGDRMKRDKAYHNGTVWPWLLGPFTTAFLKVKGCAEYRREYALKNFLLPLFTEQVLKAGLGAISEIFDGDPPHIPRGCIAQAWSIAEPLRAYVEDVMQTRPKYEKEVLESAS